MIKVYATMEVKNNLITTIPFKGVQVRVEFAGGNSMKNIPAKFYTRDPFTQRALDNSDQLGRLYYLHQTIKEAGDTTAPAKPAGEAAGTTAPETPAGEAAGTTAPETPAGEAAGTTAPETPAGEAAGTMAANEGTLDADQQQSVERLEFGNLGEAITYVATKYGEQIETESAVRKFIAEKEGVKVIIHKGV